MPTLHDYADQPLEWFRLDSWSFALQRHGKTLATIDWEDKKKLVVARAEGEYWLFENTSVLSNDVKIYPGEARNSLKAAVPLASFEFHYREERQELRFAHGLSFIWSWQRSATPTLNCHLLDGPKILCIQTLRHRLTNPVESILQIELSARDFPETPLLAFFGFYIARLALWEGEHDLRYNPRAWINLLFAFLGGRY